jgi:hypothetical protein
LVGRLNDGHYAVCCYTHKECNQQTLDTNLTIQIQPSSYGFHIAVPLLVILSFAFVELRARALA